MGKHTRLNHLVVVCIWLLVWAILPTRARVVYAQESERPSSARLAPEGSARQFVTAINGVAFALEKKAPGVEVVPLQTSLPVFRAFGLSRDQKRLLYVPFKNGIPSGELCLEDVSTGDVTSLQPRVVLLAAWSPTDDNRIACSFGGIDAFGIGVLDLDSGRFTVLARGNLLPESFRWDQSGNGLHYLEATGDAMAPAVVPRYVPIKPSGPGQQALPDPPADFPVMELPSSPATQVSREETPTPVIPDASATVAPGDMYAFRVRTPDGTREILGENVTGTGRLFLAEPSGRTTSLGEGQLLAVLDHGVVVRRFSTAGTSIEYLSWGGTAVDLAASVLSYNVPMVAPTLVQGGQGYSAPGNCNVGSHVNAMLYAYDFWDSTVGAHVMAAADGLVVFTSSSVTCNTIDKDCPDYSAGGCSGTFFGNVVILQHSDGTYTKYAHMETNSVQVAPGTAVCQGLYIGRQGHTGSTNGSFNACGDHLHFQRQSAPDIFGQSIAIDFADVPSNPLSCGTVYPSASIETSHSISPSSASFGIPGGSGSVTVSSTGCSWTAVSNDSWITITDAGSGSGHSVVTYSVADNSTSGDRTGTMYIAGQTFVVSQSGGGVTNQAPVVSAGSDQAITLPATATLNGTATDDGLPDPPATLSLQWTTVSGPGTVDFTSPQSLSTSAGFSMAGVYVLRLTASDSALTTSDDVIVVVNTTSGTGSLAGSPSSPPSSVNLTNEGTSDWAHWGLTTPTSFNHKATGNSQISNYVQIGSISSVRYSGNSVSYSWSDGDPTSAVSGTNSGIYVYGVGNGFELVVPADTSDRTLKLYVGLYKARGRLETTLSDGSASPFVDTSFVNLTGASNTVFSLRYRSGGTGHSLIVRWTIEAASDSAANITLQAATLAVNTAGGTGQLSGSLATAPAAVDLTAQGTLDWAHWGLTSATSFNHRAGVTQQISNFTAIGSGTVNRQQASPTSYSWTNGTPTAAVSNTSTGVYKIGQGTGFELTVPADTTARTLGLYVGLWAAQGKLEATLSDGSASNLVDTGLVNQTGTSNGLYTLTYQAGSAGQTLRIRWTLQTSFHSYGNVTLQAAILTTAGAPANQAPTVNAGPDQAITLPNSATLAGTASDDGLPNPPGGLTTTWSQVSGPGTVTFANASSLNTSAGFSVAGSYTLRLTADDGALSGADDLVVTVSDSSSVGILSGSLATPGPSVDLTAEGMTDWAHWGLNNSRSFDHRAGVIQQISNFSHIGTSSVQRQKASPTSYSWTNGTPTPSATDTPSGVYKIGTGNGFRLTLPADTTPRTLRLYLGLWAAQGRLEVSLSDNSAPSYVDTSLINQTATSNGVYTLNYQAASAGQTLTIRWTVQASFNNFGNVTLQSATLQ